MVNHHTGIRVQCSGYHLLSAKLKRTCLWHSLICTLETRSSIGVHLVELKGTGELFAMKAMDKDVMLNRNKEETKSWKKLITIAVSGSTRMVSNHLLFKTMWTNFEALSSTCMWVGDTVVKKAADRPPCRKLVRCSKLYTS
ncbi:hypothetical protein BVRB_9g213470 [Beta vulgaris subsp. vulgaris]|nr:hypothetical protein BVRB_9g213470 [Beta vulgaris subsp. vulgaris]